MPDPLNGRDETAEAEQGARGAVGAPSALSAGIIEHWAEVVARRRLSEAELRALDVKYFSGVDGLREFQRRGCSIRARDPRSFEAACWALRMEHVEVMALLSTPVEFHGGDGCLCVFRMISGAARITQGNRTSVHRPDSVGALQADPPFVVKAQDRFSFVAIRFLRAGADHGAEASEEVTRLHAVVEAGRALLVEKLGEDRLFEREGRLLRQILEPSPSLLQEDTPGRFDDVRRRARDIIEREHRRPDLTVDSVAHALNMSRRHLYRYFAGSDPSVGALITQNRLETGAELLRSRPDLTVETVALRAGFSAPDHFRRAFARRFAMTPGEYRIRRQQDE